MVNYNISCSNYNIDLLKWISTRLQTSILLTWLKQLLTYIALISSTCSVTSVTTTSSVSWV